jgi:hypothetical protein
MYSGILDSGQKIVTDGLVLNLDAAQLRSYPTTGTTWTDLSGQGNNGTLVNGVGFDSGNGGGLTFDGVNDYVNCGTSLSILNNITAQCWIKTTSADQQVFIGKWDNLINQRSWYIGTFTSGGNLQVILSATGDSTFNRYTGSVINDGNWKNVCFTFSSGTILLYVNGESNLVTQIGSNTINSLFNSTAKLLLGANADGTQTFLNGSVSTSLIYNKVLSATEVLQNYNATKSRFGL